MDLIYSSFRDPAGQMYTQDGVLYRAVNPVYQPQYQQLMESGLYDELVKARLLIPHREEGTRAEAGKDVLVLRPKRIPFISYPYEWCFGQYKDAALATLRIHLMALEHGMILKDASAYNIQFLKGHAVLIDTLSFEVYEEGRPWVAYGQFCRHFVAPLLLMAEVDVQCGKMMQNFIDGLPLDLADHLLKGRGGLFAKQHIQLHAKSVGKHAQEGKKEMQRQAILSKSAQEAMIRSLLQGISKLTQGHIITEWGDYYSTTNYSEEAADHKREMVQQYLAAGEPPKTVWDLGANDGRYSRLGVEAGAHVVAFDIDPVAVERNYNAVRKSHEAMLPLILDLTCPSPAIGFANKERVTIGERQRPHAILALAVIHHLAISNNLPFEKIAQWLASLGGRLIIEFVPKEDEQVQLLLRTRDDIFPNYHSEGFEKAFGKYYRLVDKHPVEGSKRSLYCFEVKEN